MNKTAFEGKLRKTRGKLKGQWAQLTSDEIGQLDASFDQMIGLFQERYGYTKERASREVDRFWNHYIQRKQSPLENGLEFVRQRPWLLASLLAGLLLIVRAFIRPSAPDSTPPMSDA